MRGVGDGMGRLWSRDSEVANEISGGGYVLGMIVVARWMPVEVRYATRGLEILAR